MGVTVIKPLPELAGKIKGERLAPVMKRLSNYLVSSAQKKISGDVPPPNAPLTAELKQGGKTLRDTGALMSSISAHSGDLWASAGTNKRQAKILQEGGTVAAKKGDLWIPACLEAKRLMKRLGATTAGELIPRLKSAGWKTWRQGNLFLGRKDKGDAPLALFILKRSVEIPARPFLYIDDNDKKHIEKTIRDFLESELGGKG